jgi:hypothetical protein
MKKLINEITRMQHIAGIITESEYQETLMNEVSKKDIIKLGNAIIKIGKELPNDDPENFPEEDGEDIITVGEEFINNGIKAGFKKFWSLDTVVRDTVYEILYDDFRIDLDDYDYDYNNDEKPEWSKEEDEELNKVRQELDKFNKGNLKPYHPETTLYRFPGTNDINSKDMTDDQLKDNGYYRMTDDEVKKYNILGDKLKNLIYTKNILRKV